MNIESHGALFCNMIIKLNFNVYVKSAKQGKQFSQPVPNALKLSFESTEPFLLLKGADIPLPWWRGIALSEARDSSGARWI